jgi:NTP pyrophosphatase (non-canonical NTP hydrolase)
MKDFQKYVEDLEKERGFTEQSSVERCLHLGEEIGELFKAVRKAEKMKIDESSRFTPVEEELADILIFLCSIANRYDIDLEKAFREKEEINKKRTWKIA